MYLRRRPGQIISKYHQDFPANRTDARMRGEGSMPKSLHRIKIINQGNGNQVTPRECQAITPGTPKEEEAQK